VAKYREGLGILPSSKRKRTIALDDNVSRPR